MSALTVPQPAPRQAAVRPEATPVPDEPVHRFTVDEYHEIIRAGVLNTDDPLELLEGLLVQKMPKNPPHTIATQFLRDLLLAVLPAGWFVSDQEPVTTLDSEPEPDALVIRGTRRNYLERHPTPESVGLIVEVADATLRRDRGRKKRIYARANVPVYWIVNLIDRQVEVYTAPSGPDAAEPDYAQVQTYGPDDALPVVLDGNEVGRLTVRDLLP